MMKRQEQNSDDQHAHVMTHQQALDAAKTMGIDALDAQLLLLHALSRASHERAWLLVHDTDPLLEEVQTQYMALLERRAVSVPVAYLTGEKEFYGLPFSVDKRVLVPRPETETLVEWALEIIERQDNDAHHPPFKVLDMGTGSGILAITLKHLHSSIEMSATDQSEQALSMASLNASELLAQAQSIHFYQGSWFSAVQDQKFDLVVSNPPYIAENDVHLAALAHEPIEALVSGQDGLDDIRDIVQNAGAHLMPNGWLLLEHGYDQAQKVRELLEQAGFVNIQTRVDLAGIERITGAQWLAGL